VISERGQSATLGVVLLLGMTVVTAGLIVATGGTAIEAVREEVDATRANTAGDSFGAAVTGATTSGGARAFGTGGVPLETYDAGELRVEANGEELVSESLGTAVLGAEGSRVVVQGGAVIDVSDGRGVMRDPPDVSVVPIPDGGLSLSVGLVDIDGETGGSERVVIRRNDTTVLYPDGGEKRTNPVATDRFEITVESEFYRAWGSYFERSFGPANVSYDHPAESVTVAQENDAVTAPVLAGTPNGELRLTGGVNVESYNSGDGDAGDGQVVTSGDVSLRGGGDITDGLRSGGNVSVTGGSKLAGDVGVAGDFELRGGSEIGYGSFEGDVRVGGNVTIKRGTSFTGNLTYSGELNDPGGVLDDTNVTKRERITVEVGTTPGVSDYINRRTSAIRAGADTSDHIQDERITCSVNTCEIGPGEYFLEEFSASGREIVFNTTAGNVDIAVAGDTAFGGSETVRVEGDGRVNVFAKGDYTQRGGATVTNDGRDAPQFWLYLRPNATADLNGGGEFVGAIYGASNETSDGSTGARIEPSIPVYGALVGDIEFVGGGTTIHYDAALEGARPLPETPTSHLRVYETTANVSAA
jgi:hypothetical protein